MKRLLLLGAVLMLATSTAWPLGLNMSAGPGGRIYITHWYDDGAGSTYRKVYSLGFGTTWTVTDPNELHGTVLDNDPGNQSGWTGHRECPIGGSPEIEASAANPETGYADLVMGLANNNPKSPVSIFANGAVTNLVRVTPTSGGIGTVTQFGAGKAGGGTDCNTDGILFATVDPVGLFTGAPGRYIVHGTNAANQTGNSMDYKILNSVAESGDGDPSDDDSDYVVVDIKKAWNEADAEVYGDRFFVSAQYPSFGGVNNRDGIFYNDASDSYNQKAWYCRQPAGATVPVTIPLGPDPALSSSSGGFAVGWAKDAQGNNHTAVWATLGFRSQIWALVDWNDDGDAMDNMATSGGPSDEYFKVYDSAWSGFGDLAAYPDLEFVEGPNGVNFLMGMSSQPTNVPYVRVYQLADNGELMATSSTTPDEWWAHLSIRDGNNQNILPGGANVSFEVDWGQFGVEIPEPGTMLLVGTGVLAVAGYLRRRRMK